MAHGHVIVRHQAPGKTPHAEEYVAAWGSFPLVSTLQKNKQKTLILDVHKSVLVKAAQFL